MANESVSGVTSEVRFHPCGWSTGGVGDMFSIREGIEKNEAIKLANYCISTAQGLISGAEVGNEVGEEVFAIGILNRIAIACLEAAEA